MIVLYLLAGLLTVAGLYHLGLYVAGNAWSSSDWL